MRNHGYLRNYAGTVRLLASRGHTVIIGSRGRERHMAVDTDGYLAALSRDYPQISTAILPKRRDGWRLIAQTTRAYRNALRYRHPRFHGAARLAERAHAKLDRLAPRLASTLPPWPVARALSSLAAVVESAIPTDPEIDRTVAALAPDAIVVTPLVDFDSYQVDYVKTARRLGIPVAAAVASWDNLTNKGIIAVQPDRVLVWNEAQKREAIELHGVRPAHVRVTGAQLFDDWFERRPSTTREAFCRRVALDPAKPFFLYLCSSLFIAPEEAAFVQQWIAELRRSSFPALRGCGVLVRPHPGHAGPWADVDLSAFGNVVVWPRGGDMPLFEDAKAAYFDSLFHSAAIVAINTTGMIEAGIAGRASFTVLAPEFAATQHGTLHFAHLTAPGFLRTARTMAEHHAQLDAELRTPSTPAALAPFLEQFVRPRGLSTPATPIVAAAMEEVGSITATAQRDPLGARVLRPILAGVGRLYSGS